MQDKNLLLHGIAIKKHASVQDAAGAVGLDSERAKTLAQEALAAGRVQEAGGKLMLTPAAQMALQSEYATAYAALRDDPAFLAACDDFEAINTSLKQIITDWQTMTVGGESVANDHTDPDYDANVIDALGDVHEKAEAVLERLAAKLPRLGIYQRKLLAALEAAEDGDTACVSDARTESYHTVWFELHEDLLRVAGRQRAE